MKLDQRQVNRLRDLESAWKDRSTAIQALDVEYNLKRAALEKEAYDNVVNLTAAALEVGVPKSQIGRAVGTKNYAANRKELHADALKALALMESAPGAKTAQEIDLTDEGQSAVWANDLRLTYMGVDRGMDRFEVKDPAGRVKVLLDAGVFPQSADENVSRDVENALVDQADIIKQKMQEAKNG